MVVHVLSLQGRVTTKTTFQLQSPKCNSSNKSIDLPPIVPTSYHTIAHKKTMYFTVGKTIGEAVFPNKLSTNTHTKQNNVLALFGNLFNVCSCEA
eukprot:1833033-Amphidinium_carterae.1